MKAKIVGAGLSGLICASMMRNKIRISERMKELPNSHKALLRFRTDAVSNAVGIPFKKVRVRKDINNYFDNDVANAIAYGRKCTGSICTRTLKAESVERYIAPEDFVKRLYKQVKNVIDFGDCLTYDDIINNYRPPIISTIPLPTMLRLVYGDTAPDITFETIGGYTARLRLPNCNAYVTVYDTNPKHLFYRYSITGDMLICEGARVGAYKDFDYKNDNDAAWAFIVEQNLGLGSGSIIDNYHKIEWSGTQYQKILPIDENLRRQLILKLTQDHGIFSLGRYATWRPNLLLDDVVNDVRVIQRILSGDNALIYNRNMP